MLAICWLWARVEGTPLAWDWSRSSGPPRQRGNQPTSVIASNCHREGKEEGEEGEKKTVGLVAGKREGQTLGINRCIVDNTTTKRTIQVQV